MDNVNRYGLARHIPESTKLEIRQRSGFGCVLCGLLLYTYAHIDPPFSDARTHSADGIALLCPNCHTRFDTRQISVATIKSRMAEPFALSQGFTSDPLYLPDLPAVDICGNHFTGDAIIAVRAHPLLWFEKSNVSETPILLNALFIDESGREVARIVRNEFRGDVRNFDVSKIADRILLRSTNTSSRLVIRRTGGNIICIEEIDMAYAGHRVQANMRDGITIDRMINLRWCVDGYIRQAELSAWNRSTMIALGDIAADCGNRRELAWQAARFGKPIINQFGFAAGFCVNQYLVNEFGCVVGKLHKGAAYWLLGSWSGIYKDQRLTSAEEIDPQGMPIYIPKHRRLARYSSKDGAIDLSFRLFHQLT